MNKFKSRSTDDAVNNIVSNIISSTIMATATKRMSHKIDPKELLEMSEEEYLYRFKFYVHNTLADYGKIRDIVRNYGDPDYCIDWICDTAI